MDNTNAEPASSKLRAERPQVCGAIPEDVFLIDRNGVYVNCIARASSDPSVMPDDARGRPVSDLLPEPVAEAALAAIREAIETGEIRSLEFELPLPGGARHFEARLRATNADQVVVVIRDITESRWQAAEREVMLRILRIAASGVDHGLLIHDMLEEVRELFSLPNLYLALYDAGAELIRFPYFTDEKDPYPDPRRPGRTSTDWIIRNRKVLHVSPEQFRAMVASGELELVGTPALTWLGVPLSGQGGAIGALVAQNYTARNAFGPATERLMQVAAHHISIALAKARSDERLARLNDCFLRFGPDPVANIGLLTGLCGELLGAAFSLYNRLEEGMLISLGRWNAPPDLPTRGAPGGRLCSDVISAGGSEPFVVRNLPETAYAQSDASVTRHGLQTYVGKAVSFAGRSVGSLCALYRGDIDIDASDKDVLNIIGAAIGVEEARRHAANELRKLNAELEHRVTTRTAELSTAVDELREFCYSVSHDLRAPLRHVDGFAQVLLEDHGDALGEHGLMCVARLRNAGRHMGLLIDGLLELSRITRSEMRPQWVDVSAMAQSIVGGLAHGEPHRSVTIDVEAGIRMWGDEALLHVAFSNLLANAWKFTSKTVNARIEVSAADTERGRTVCIRDNGAGFDATYAHKLFKPFERLHDADDFPGTGMGLAAVERVARRHGGSAWAEGAPGQGATLYFSLPPPPTPPPT